MDNFNHWIISSIRATEESALRINILDNKFKWEVAAAAQVIDKVNRTHEQANNIVAIIVVDKNPTAERKSIRFSQDQEDVSQELEDIVQNIGLTRTFL